MALYEDILCTFSQTLLQATQAGRSPGNDEVNVYSVAV